jgi:sulfur transfer complex TusBCD TusB component (DsrH family)
MGAFESGQSFLAGVLSKLPAEQQAQARAIFDAAEAKDAVVLLGDGALARSDYSRSMDSIREQERTLNEYYARLDGWYADNKATLDAARSPGGGDPTPPQERQPAPGAGGTLALTQDDIRRIANDAVNEAGRDYIAVSAFLATQGARHSHLFNEPLDMTELVANAKLGKPIYGQPGRVYSLQDAYMERYGERINKKQQEAEDKRINDEVDKRLGEKLKLTQSGHPFPLRQESSPLDVLQTKDGAAAHTLDSAVAEYERLVAAKQG